MEYYLFVSNDCNLNCRYCSVLLDTKTAGIPSKPVYSISKLNKFIDTLQTKQNDRVADIVFFGGEPTLNYQFIADVIESQRKLQGLPYSFRYMLHTNGLLLQKMPDTILCNLDTIMLSINYDRVPHNNLQTGYFREIADAIRSIRKRKSIPIIGRLTITEETSLYSEVALFNSFFDAIYWQIENKQEFEDFDKYLKNYRFELHLLLDLWLSYLRKGVLLKLVPFMAAACFYYESEVPDAFCCGYNNSMIYIQTNGTCYTCAEDMLSARNLVGSIINGIKFPQFGLKDTECMSCSYLTVCKGRCGRMHSEFSADHIKEYCILNKIMFDLIKNHLDKIRELCARNNIRLSVADPIYHYTEYTP